MIVVVYGPPMSGKTRFADEIAAKLNCSKIIDAGKHFTSLKSVLNKDKTEDDVLFLTNSQVSKKLQEHPRLRKVVHVYSLDLPGVIKL